MSCSAHPTPTLDVRPSPTLQTSASTQVFAGHRLTVTARARHCCCAPTLDRSLPSRGQDLRRRPAETKRTRKDHQLQAEPRRQRVRRHVDIAAARPSALSRTTTQVAMCYAFTPPQVHLECLDYPALQDFRDFRAWQGLQEFLVFPDLLDSVETTVCSGVV